MRNLILILGDQLSRRISALDDGDPAQDAVVMAEVHEEATYTSHHKKKLVLIFSAMRHFADELRCLGWTVHYQRYQPGNKAVSLLQAVHAVAAEQRPEKLITTDCGEWRLDADIRQWQSTLGIPVHHRPDTRFIASKAVFSAWAEDRKQLRMEFFYREMRRKTGLLMNPDGTPEGGQWNFDNENRRKWNGKPPVPAPFRIEPDAITRDVISTVNTHFPNHFGTTDNFHFAVTSEDADAALTHFLDGRLPWFGDFQDAMADQEEWLFHSVLSPYINCGLLDPLAVCKAAVKRHESHQAPLNAVEGFIRQIIGWREFVRGIYWLKMPDYARENQLGNTRPLPRFYWTGETGMRCMKRTIETTQRNGYAHHIQRLMVTGNFALLAGIRPEEICNWYLAVYVDAYDWVELPNTLGMVMHADGGVLGSKPYAASGKYIQRMSDYCKHCQYNVKHSSEDDACPFNALYWHFLNRHEEIFSSNPRMALMYRNWQKQSPERRQALLERAEWLIDNMERL